MWEIYCHRHAQQKAESREMLRIILSSIRFLGRQGIALRGRYKSADTSSLGGEVDSNLVQLRYELKTIPSSKF